MNHNWLPEGKKAAVVFSIDDVHPARSTDYYEAGGDMEKGALGFVEDLLTRHPKLKLTIFLTADWRMISPFPTYKVLSRIPYLRDRIYLTRVQEKGKMHLKRHPQFVSYLKNLPNTEIAFHGLHHIHRGLKTNVEFQEQSKEEIRGILEEIEQTFRDVGLNYTRGLCPPNWHAPDNLIKAMIDMDFKYLASARDLFTEISPTAVNSMSGMKGVSIIYPQYIYDNKLVHIPANFNATRKMERAFSIIEHNGIISIKAHIAKNLAGHILYDGVDESYMNYIDALLTIIENRYGDQIWMTSMNEIAERMLALTKTAV